jgi:hypothetical protein
MSLETHIAGSEDQLISGLHFSGSNTASYITDRRQVSFAPQSASNFKPSGSRLMRFSLADEQGFLDGATVRLIFKITNLSATVALTPVCDSPASMFRRLRILCNGSGIVEDVEQYERVHQMFSELLPSQRRMNNICESWGGSTAASTLSAPGAGAPIAADSERTVVVHLMSSFFSQGKMIPLSMIPAVLELELGELNAAFSGDANKWEISRPRLVADVVTLDQSLMNSYSSHVLSGKSLPMPMTGLYSVTSAIPIGSSQYSFPIVRGFTRLQTIYVSFHDNDAQGKFTTRFYSPLDGEENLSATDNMEYYFQVGSDRYPQFSVDSHQESFYRLRLAQLIHQGSDSFSITPAQYRTNKFIIGQNFERAPGSAAHSGLNTRSGSQLTINLKHTSAATVCHVVLIYSQILDVSAAGCQILD